MSFAHRMRRLPGGGGHEGDDNRCKGRQHFGQTAEVRERGQETSIQTC